MTQRPAPSRNAMPSSFNDDADFRQDNRMAKLKRLILADPLVPIGCLVTIAALIGATRAMRKNDHRTANKMFRRRIYAQGFTIVAIVLGSGYYNKDKEARKKDIENEKERSRIEKRDKWLAELDFRDAEERVLKKEREERRRRRAAGETGSAESEGYMVVSRDGEESGKVTEAVKGLMWSKDGSEKKDR